MQLDELKKLVRLLHIDIVRVLGKNVKRFNPRFEVNPLQLISFRKKIVENYHIQNKKNKGCPWLYQDKFGICYAYIEGQNSQYFIGPMSLVSFSEQSKQTYLDFYGLKQLAFPLISIDMEKLLDMISLVCSILTGRSWAHDDLVANNPSFFQEDSKNWYSLTYDLDSDEVIEGHHTYQEERNLLAFVKNGAAEEALAYQSALDKSIGRLSNQEVTHWRNLTIVAITLSTRAAIEGGLTPALAYKISDYYIRQCEGKLTVAEMIHIRNRAVKELAEQVKSEQKIQTQSSYIKASMSYIEKHYRDKIYLEEVADFVGLSSTYFSKLFRKEAGISFQQFVTQVRLEAAANLLRYSNESLATISDYVNFPSQSYFGRYFKAHYHMTPKTYRDLYHITEKSS